MPESGCLGKRGDELRVVELEAVQAHVPDLGVVGPRYDPKK